MRQLTTKSFEFSEPDEIRRANNVERLISVTKTTSGKSGGETWACAWAPDNSYFAWSSGHRILHLIPWDNNCQKRHDPGAKCKRKYHLIDCSDIIWSVAFGSGCVGHKDILGYGCHMDTSLIVATGLASGKIKLWSCQKGTLIIELLDHRDTVRCLDFTRDGNLQLLSASRDGTLKMWDVPDGGNMYSTFKIPGGAFTGCRFAPNAKFIAGVGRNKVAYLWKTPNVNKAFVKLEGHHNEVSCCDFSSDSALLATGSYDTKVIVWCVHSQTMLRVLGHMHPSPRMIFAGGANDHYVRSVSFCPSGLNLTSVCEDGYVRFWNLDDQPDDPFVIADTPEAVSGQTTSDGSVLAVGFRDGDVMMFSACQQVPSLLHLSRQSVLKCMVAAEFDQLPIPCLLQHYLTYPDLMDQSRD